MTKNAVVLLSGGQDSATCLAIAKQKHKNIVAIAFDYNQRHKIELKQAKKIAKIAKTPLSIIKLPFIQNLSQNALTDTTKKIETSTNSLPSTFVPGRNLFFLSIAAVYARQLNCNIVYTGVCQTDYSGYPDCRQKFITALTKTISLALEQNIKIKTPLMNLTKAETVLLMKKLGYLDWYKHTHTCYYGIRPACGKCPACKLRLNGFKTANIKDPLPYKKV